MNPKLVSIVIPTYKRRESLQRAIASAKDQTYQNLEIIVVNDNGADEFTDYVLNLISQLENIDNRIKLVDYQGNRNGAYARNAGIKESKGEYIAFLDDDDFFYPQKIERQVNHLEFNLNKFDAVYCKLRKENGVHIMDYYEGDLSKFILKQISMTPTPTLLFKRPALLDIGGFDTQLLRHQDYDLMLRFFEKYKIGFVNEYLVEQGPNDGENMIFGKKLEETKKYFLQKFESHINKLNKIDQKELYVINYFNMAIANLKRGVFYYGFKNLIQSFLFSPVTFSKHLVKFARKRFGK